MQSREPRHGTNVTQSSTISAVTGIELLAAALLAGCTGGEAAAPAPQPPEVAVVTVQRAAVPVTTELPGRTSAFLVAQVRARVDGIVLKRAFKEGGDVKVGQRLYQIDPAPYRAALDSAQAALAEGAGQVSSPRPRRPSATRCWSRRTSSASRITTTPSPRKARRRRTSPPARPRSQTAQDQPGLHERGLADRRAHRHIAGHAGRVRAGERARR